MAHTKQRTIELYYREVFNRGRIELLEDLLAPDYVNHSPGSPEQPRDRAGVAEVVLRLRGAFPDLHYAIEQQVFGEQAVAVRTTLTGTHTGDFFGIAPSGRSVRVAQMAFEHFRDGRIVAHHRLTDELSLLRQIGALP